ncbi:MAG: hypothetical protein JWN52_5352 [Actinomycetia bacterium]|nr:hypothetical protein [Actinomycetes bacterium]
MKTVIKSVLRSTPRTASVVAAATVLLVGGGIVYAGASSSSTASVIHACKKKSTGALRVIAAGHSCAGGETALQWNTKGPAGPRGPVGKTGPAGAISGNALEAPSFVNLTDGAVTAYTLSLPNAKYILNGSVAVLPPAGTSSVTKDTVVYCGFMDKGAYSGFEGVAHLPVGQSDATSSFTGYATSGTSATIYCGLLKGGPVRVRASFTAVQVTTLGSVISSARQQPGTSTTLPSGAKIH